MLSKLKLLSTLCLIIIYCQSVYSQDSKAILENDKQIVYKISQFSIETEKMIKKDFKNEPNSRIVYVCQETGVIVIEAKNKIETVDKEKILVKINNAIGKSEIHEEKCTYKDAENNCLLKSGTKK